MRLNKKIFFFDSLRGIFCLIVILYHLNEVLDSIFINNFFVKNGLIVVDFFFVISGFVITYNYSSKINSFQNLIRFQIKRLIRLYPLHLVMLIIFGFLEIIKFFFFIKTGILPNHNMFSTNNLDSFIKNIFLLQGFLLNNTFNNPSWSISQEFYTYFAFGLVIFFVKTEKIRMIIFSIILITSYFFIYKYELQSQTNIYGSVRCFFCFFLGASLVIIKKNIKEVVNIHLINIFNLLTLCLLFLGIFNKFYLSTILIFATFIITNLISKKNFVLNFLKKKIFIFLGSISYGIYMIHFFIIYITIQSVRLYIFNTHNDLIFSKIEIKNYLNAFESHLLLLLIILLTIFISFLSKLFLENYFKSIGNKISIKK